jgi:uncharacterized protein
VDVARKRIALTMRDQQKSGGQQQGRQQQGGGNRPGGNKPDANKGQSKKQEPLNPFQAKLMELKKKFKD